jgi:DNA-binding PadR family transcriptional regulator
MHQRKPKVATDPTLLESEFAKFPTPMQFVLMTIINELLETAYVANICRELASHTSKPVADAQIYVAIKRLQQVGFVTSEKKQNFETHDGAHRVVTIYRLTDLGIRTVRATAAYLAELDDCIKPKVATQSTNNQRGGYE